MPPRMTLVAFLYPTSYLPKDSSTRMAGKDRRDSSVPIWRQTQHTIPEKKVRFGEFSFQMESGISLYLIQFTNKSRDLYLIGLDEEFKYKIIILIYYNV